MLVGARDDEAVEALPGEFGAEGNDPVTIHLRLFRGRLTKNSWLVGDTCFQRMAG
jgi:hypothetical protein